VETTVCVLDVPLAWQLPNGEFSGLAHLYSGWLVELRDYKTGHTISRKYTLEETGYDSVSMSYNSLPRIVVWSCLLCLYCSLHSTFTVTSLLAF
jgi:hypothetical protein